MNVLAQRGSQSVVGVSAAYLSRQKITHLNLSYPWLSANHLPHIIKK